MSRPPCQSDVVLVRWSFVSPGRGCLLHHAESIAIRIAKAPARGLSFGYQNRSPLRWPGKGRRVG
jgi:hypothetical protein